MYFMIKNSQLLEKYNEFWDKVNNATKNILDSDPLCNEK